MAVLKRSYIIMLIGVGTLVTGSVVFGVNSSILATDFLSNNLVIKKVIIEPGEKYTTKVTIQNEGTVSILMRTQPFQNDVSASIINEKGNTIWQERFNGDHIGNFEAEKGKSYQVVLKNVDKSSVSVDAIIGNVPFLGLHNNLGLSNVHGTIAGLVAGMTGLLTLVIGAVMFFSERRSKKMISAQ